MVRNLEINTHSRAQALDITSQVQKALVDAGVEEGWCGVYVPHTTAGVAINEAADPDVMADVLMALERLVPWQGGYRHAEGNSAAHVKSILTGSSVQVPIVGGRLALGTWQGIFFLEFDGPRRRRVLISVSPAQP
ncbi:MAG: secondary thiamine-phosphate synthase enzyme YjbQ [Pseudomonadota bacterium]